MALELKAIYLSPGHDFKGRYGKGRLHHGIQQVTAAECVAGCGLVGDRYFNYQENFKGQVSFFDWAVYEEIKAAFNRPDLDPSAFRRNLLVTGLDLNELIGKRFSLQGIEFEGSETCAPCFWMDEAVAPGVFETLKGRGGLRARILSSGLLTTANT